MAEGAIRVNGQDWAWATVGWELRTSDGKTCAVKLLVSRRLILISAAYGVDHVVPGLIRAMSAVLAMEAQADPVG